MKFIKLKIFFFIFFLETILYLCLRIANILKYYRNTMPKSKKKILFIYLNSFSGTGGIEKFNACLMKSIGEYTQNRNIGYEVISLADVVANTNYLPQNLFRGFANRKFQAMVYAFWKIFNADIVLLGHINLIVLGLWTLLFPNKKLLLVAHGIEVWQDLSFWKKKVLQYCTKILAVSNFTKQQMMQKQGLDGSNITIFPNTLNPFFVLPTDFHKPLYLLERYKIHSNSFVFVTLARLSSAEQYKGYDRILEALPMVLTQYPTCKYVIAGKYDDKEYTRITEIITKNNLQNNVILTGFVQDTELIDHYLLADTFIMPSSGEGFGIVYLEAMACGLGVIAGNKDGSTDALKNGELGQLINPESIEQIANAMLRSLQNPLHTIDKQKIQQQVLHYFGFESFKQNTKEVFVKYE